MSGAAKRCHEEIAHSESSSFSKLSSDYHSPYDVGAATDARLPKISRTESREVAVVDRKIVPSTTFRMPSDLHVDSNAAAAAAADEEPRDSREHHRFENRDARPEMARELYGDLRRDSQNAKGSEKDSRHDGRGDDNKDVKYDRETYNDAKTEVKNDKDGYGASNTHLSWKDSKDYHRGKRYSDSPLGTMDAWIPRAASQGHAEVAKEASTLEERDHVEVHEAVGENKFDSKGDDKFKDKDRKRKEAKHRDWGERDKERVDRRSTVPQLSDAKESTKEERDTERWERERKDPLKDKERGKEREKDQTKREMWNGASDKESNEKEFGDGSNRLQEQENVTTENKKQKESESWKTVSKESRDRRKERDVDGDGDRTEKRTRGLEKESDDGCAADVEGGVEREREVYNYAVQQRKRMQRSRGSPQVTNREPRFRTRTQENEGSQVTGKAEVSSVVYKVGECMQELIKLWKEYEASQAEKTSESSSGGPTLEIRIPAEHVTATNRQVRGGQLWGTDIYTDDSDLVAVLMHTGYCRPTASPPPSAIQELRATIRVLPPQDCYISTLRNNVRSRAWGAAIGCSYRVERCCIVKGGGTIDLEPCLTHTSTVEPTLAPVAVERTMTTRAAASNALRQQRFVREVTIQYNLCNEPWIKYSISIVADKGLKKPLYTSARLKKGEVLYLETHSCRYELCYSGEKMVKTIQQSSHAQNHEAEAEKSQNHHSHSANGESENIVIDAFRWSRCKKPLPQKVMRSVGIPLPHEHVEVLEENLDWEDVQWSQTGVWIAGKEYILARVHFLSMN